jgi:D-alanyl-D-alanine carboxypeptidase
VASVTKLFVGVLVMQLVEDGVFALDDPIDKWLSDKTLKRIANADQVSIRQLLNHTSGIYDLIDDNAFYLAILNHPGRKWKPDELLEYVRGDDAVFPPGTDVEYSNTNFLLTAMIIEAATGQSHATLLRQRILDPLSLSDTYYHWHEGLPDLVAQGYFDLYNNGNLLEMSNFNTGSGNGYGGLYSTIYDMRTFVEALLRDKTLLSPASLEEMLTITSEDLVSGEAYGVTIRKDFLDRSADEFGLGHRGRDLAYSADLFYFPTRDRTMAYLVNYGTDANSELREVFLRFREAMVDAMMKE